MVSHKILVKHINCHVQRENSVIFWIFEFSCSNILQMSWKSLSCIQREFSYESNFEFGPHLPKLLSNINWLPFLRHSVDEPSTVDWRLYRRRLVAVAATERSRDGKWLKSPVGLSDDIAYKLRDTDLSLNQQALQAWQDWSYNTVAVAGIQSQNYTVSKTWSLRLIWHNFTNWEHQNMVGGLA